MNKVLVLFLFLLFSQVIYAQNEVGPEGNKLIWIALILLFVVILLFFSRRKGDKKMKTVKPLSLRRKIIVELDKDRLYYPDNLKLTVKNNGESDVDLAEPLLMFDNFWLKRKFRLKGTGNRVFYPLYLEKGNTHVLQIDLARFYSHDKGLKKFPKTKVVIYDVKGKKLGSRSVFLRKTLFKF